MTTKILRIEDAEYFNSASVEFTDHPTEDVRTYLESSLEPAPPKDWKPYCYDEVHNICSLVGLVNNPPKCWNNCPYRNRRD